MGYRGIGITGLGATTVGTGTKGKSNARSTPLVKLMTTHEKLEQLTLRFRCAGDRSGREEGLGGVFSLTDPAKINELQHVGGRSSRGCTSRSCSRSTRSTASRRSSRSRSAEASSFDPDVAATDDTIAARESAAFGIKQIY